MAGNPFLLAPEVNANPLLSDSWSRCQRYGLDPATEDFPRLGAGELADRLASHRGLQQLAQPVVEALSRQVADLQSVVILSDPDGLVLHTLGDTQALQKAQRVALAPGNLWSESGRGTNAIGTALAIDDGCEIDGRQHFLTRNQNLYCAAMPLQRPDGSIAGVLDISGPANFPHQHTFGWVKAAAKQIEYLWVKQSLHPEQWLMSLHRQVDKLDSVEELLLVFFRQRPHRRQPAGDARVRPERGAVWPAHLCLAFSDADANGGQRPAAADHAAGPLPLSPAEPPAAGWR